MDGQTKDKGRRTRKIFERSRSAIDKLTRMRWSVNTLLVLLLLSILIHEVVSGTLSQGHNSVTAGNSKNVTILWEERMPTDISSDFTAERTKERRPLVRFSGIPTTKEDKPKDVAIPHPLRTDEWKLRMNFRSQKLKASHSNKLVLEFADNGYVRTVQQNGDFNSSSCLVGSWELLPSGLTWKLDLEGSNGTEEYSFYADLHLNPFGDQPRLTRGVVLRESCPTTKRSVWFRPVVATFTGVGIGRDTADLSYRDRR